MSIKQIIEENEVNGVSKFWNNNYITFAKDNDGNYLVCDISNCKQNIISFNICNKQFLICSSYF